ncbi:MAG TPA: hypothetical protein VFK52_00655 [Nocardioidaceae bacterium]|nr:hypothetical protein [Nocardioidaceae bacterium]
MLAPLRGESLLRVVCDLLTDRAEAARLLSLDPADHLTFAEAYCALRTLPALSPVLRRAVLDQTFELMDAETARLVTAGNG